MVIFCAPESNGRFDFRQHASYNCPTLYQPSRCIPKGLFIMTETLPHEGLRMPPPLLYLAALLVGWLLQWLFPVNLVPSSIVLFAAGVLVLLLGLALGFWAIATMRRAGESPNPAEPTAVIVSNGPFRFTRNPIYLGFTLICIGIAIAANNVW